MQKIRSKALLVVLDTEKHHSTYLDEATQEMTELVSAALIKPVGQIQARLHQPSPSHFVRGGKLDEIAVKAKQVGANVLVFNVDLTPAQARNIEKSTKVQALDRTGLILDIFGRRAKSKEGKLQVELARLNYILPRLGGLGGVMSRLGGGIGTRGPGEQELERDRRKIRRRIQRVKEELAKVRKHRALIREGRKKKNLLTVALVGYTNAGKSTLLNALTGADTFVQNKVFATLDPKAKLQNINGRSDILFVDTVGFIDNLPHTLIEAFHATLEEVVEADLLIHVLDVANPYFQDAYEAVQKVLKEIKVDEKPCLLALNKADLLDEAHQKLLERQWPKAVLISAREGQGMNSLLTGLSEALDHAGISTYARREKPNAFGSFLI